MRRLLVCALLLAGCGSNVPPVLVHFSMAADTPATLGPDFTSNAGTVMFGNGAIMMESKTDQGDFLAIVDNPPYPVTIPIGEFCLQINYTLPDGSAWASTIPSGETAGTITFKTVSSPYKVSFTHIGMMAVTPPATGTFFVDGDAEFVQ